MRYLKFLFLMILQIISNLAFAGEAQNVVTIDVGGDYQKNNRPFVSVTICVPGTNQCQTIDHILLDTGSTGLRLFSSLIPFDLPSEKDSSGKAIAECMFYGGGLSQWGPVVLADVGIGGEKSQNVPIQLWNPQYAGLPSDCKPYRRIPDTLETNESLGNGTLGVGPSLNDCAGSDCPGINIEPYYGCDGTSCTPDALAPSQWVQNPVAMLPTDNNGIMISLPPVLIQGQSSAQGKLILGLGTQANNILPADLKLFQTTHDGHFTAQWNGKNYTAAVDTGTTSLNLPADTGVHGCLFYGLCPTQETTIQATFLDVNQKPVEDVSIEIGNYIYKAPGTNVSPDFGTILGGELADIFLYGMPFFYGKTVYYGFDGKTNPRGVGPVLGF